MLLPFFLLLFSFYSLSVNSFHIFIHFSHFCAHDHKTECAQFLNDNLLFSSLYNQLLLLFFFSQLLFVLIFRLYIIYCVLTGARFQSRSRFHSQQFRRENKSKREAKQRRKWKFFRNIRIDFNTKILTEIVIKRKRMKFAQFYILFIFSSSN